MKKLQLSNSISFSLFSQQNSYQAKRRKEKQLFFLFVRKYFLKLSASHCYFDLYFSISQKEYKKNTKQFIDTIVEQKNNLIFYSSI